MTEPEAITSTPDVLLDCLVYWNTVFSVSVLAVNLAGLIAHLHAWSAHYQRCLIYVLVGPSVLHFSDRCFQCHLNNMTSDAQNRGLYQLDFGEAIPVLY